MGRASWTLLLIAAAAALGACAPQRSAAGVPSGAQASGLEETCEAHVRGHLRAAGGALEEEVRAFQRLAEETLTYRAEMIEVGRTLTARKTGRPLSGEEIGRIGEAFRALLETRRALWRIAESHECWLDVPGPEGVPGIRRTGILLSLAAALLLYDNYLLAVSLYEQDPTLRRLLNERDPAYAERRGELAPRHRVLRGGAGASAGR
jgi:hypothetical protein